MTDQEILVKYKETIQAGVERLCLKNHIEDEILKDTIRKEYQTGFLQGFKEKLEAGRQKHLEEKQTMARKMLSRGMSQEEVCELTGLSPDELQAIKDCSSGVN